MGKEADYIILGAGIIGLSIAHHLKKRKPHSKIILLEKEHHEAFHASGRNSGVLHAGIYYNSDSLKAAFCLKGNYALRTFCKEHNLPINECGKLIVPIVKEDLPQLEALYNRAIAVGTPIEKLSSTEAEKIEPNISCYEQALFSPTTATIDPKAICSTLVTLLKNEGIEINFDTVFISSKSETIVTSNGNYEAGTVINAAGLYADSIAHQYGFGTKYSILPFKGLYLKYGKNNTDIRTHIYPVPDLRFPFLGVHFTKTVDGSIKIGPTAIPAMWREQYQGFDKFSLKEFLEITYRESKLFLSNAFNFRDLAVLECRKYQRSFFIAQAKKLVKQIDPSGFTEYTTPGIRAQLMNKETGLLVQDFIVEGDAKSVHILNAVSPGFTCSFPFAEYIIDNFIVGH